MGGFLGYRARFFLYVTAASGETTLYINELTLEDTKAWPDDLIEAEIPLSYLISTLVSSDMIGVGKGKAPPRPPNRACGSPAHGSPVGGFLIGIGALERRPFAW